MNSVRDILRKIVYSIDIRPWTPAEKRNFKNISGLEAIPKSLAPHYKKRKHRPQLFLAQLRMELGQLVQSDWYQAKYLSSLLPGVNPQEYFVEYGAALGHMPNEFIDLETDPLSVQENYWKPLTVSEFLLRGDCDTAYIGSLFSPGAYLDLYPDIRHSKYNPLLHYVRHGLNEGRLASNAKLLSGNGTITYSQEFNVTTKNSEWISIRGSIFQLETSSIEILKNGLKIGNARLGLPELRSGWGKKNVSLGFQYSSELKVSDDNEVLTIQSLTFLGEKNKLGEIPLLKQASQLENRVLESYFPQKLKTPKVEGKLVQILVLTHHLGIGGGQLYLQEVLRDLGSNSEFNITVISMIGGVLEEELEELGIEVIIFTGPKPFSRNSYEQFLWDFDELLSEKQFDVFIANTTGCFAQVDWCLRNNLTGYWAIHESYTRQGWVRAAFGREIDPYVFERLEFTLTNVHSLIFEAQGTRDIVMAGLPLTNTEIVKYGIEIPEVPIIRNHSLNSNSTTQNSALTLVSVGTFEERKAQGLIVLLAKQLKELNLQVEFDLVGYKPGSVYSDSIHKSVVEFGLEKTVRLHEVTSDWQKYLIGADYFFMPSDVESMPQSMMIAMAHGVPAIGSRVFGIPELITDGVTGFVHEPNDLSDIIRVLNDAINLPKSQYKAMRDAAREFIVTHHEKSSYLGFFRQNVLNSKSE